MQNILCCKFLFVIWNKSTEGVIYSNVNEIEELQRDSEELRKMIGSLAVWGFLILNVIKKYITGRVQLWWAVEAKNCFWVFP